MGQQKYKKSKMQMKRNRFLRRSTFRKAHFSCKTGGKCRLNEIDFSKKHFPQNPFQRNAIYEIQFKRNDISQMQFKRNSFFWKTTFLTESIHMKTISKIQVEQNSF